MPVPTQTKSRSTKPTTCPANFPRGEAGSPFPLRAGIKTKIDLHSNLQSTTTNVIIGE
jgi:hypothetical protein